LVPIIDILLHHVLGMTVALLDLAFELLALAVYRNKVVVSELAPLFLDLADELLPSPSIRSQFMKHSCQCHKTRKAGP
jgi:hypothetical protein